MQNIQSNILYRPVTLSKPWPWVRDIWIFWTPAVPLISFCSKANMPVSCQGLTMQYLLLLSALFVLSTPAPRGPIWWNVEDMIWNAEDWTYDLTYNLTHMNAGGPLGFGVLGTTPPPQPGLLEGLLGLIFPTTTTTAAPTTTKCAGVIGLGLACWKIIGFYFFVKYIFLLSFFSMQSLGWIGSPRRFFHFV